MSPAKNNFFQAIAERAGTWPARSVIALLFFAFLFEGPPSPAQSLGDSSLAFRRVQHLRHEITSKALGLKTPAGIY
jgi:hypothetical protein